MASIIAKHENGKELDPSSVNVLEQLDRYAPTEIDDREDSDPEPLESNTLRPEPNVPRAKPRKRQRGEDTPPSTNSSEMLDRPTAPMFDIIPNPQYNAASRPSDSNDAYDTMMQFMQSMQNRSGGAPVPSAHQDLPTTTQPGSAVSSSMNDLQPSMSMPASQAFPIPAPFQHQQQDMAPFDFTSLIDWETSLANVQNDHLFPADEGWEDQATESERIYAFQNL